MRRSGDFFSPQLMGGNSISDDFLSRASRSNDLSKIMACAEDISMPSPILARCSCQEAILNNFDLGCVDWLPSD